METAKTKARPPGKESRANSKIIGDGNFTTGAVAPADLLLPRLEGVQQRGAHTKGPRSWVARCPSHGDRRPSLSVREFQDGSLSVKCFTLQCSTADVLAAVGLHPSDLFPRDLSDDYERHHKKRRLPPAPWRDIIRALHHHLSVVAIGAADMSAHRDLTEDDYATIGNTAAYIKSVLSEVCSDA